MIAILKELGINASNQGVSTGLLWIKSKGEKIVSSSPVDGNIIATVRGADKETYEAVVTKAQEAFKEWRQWPAPKRGEVVRQIGNELRKYKSSLGKLVSYEMGKSLQEGDDAEGSCQGGNDHRICGSSHRTQEPRTGIH